MDVVAQSDHTFVSNKVYRGVEQAGLRRLSLINPKRSFY